MKSYVIGLLQECDWSKGGEEEIWQEVLGPALGRHSGSRGNSSVGDPGAKPPKAPEF
jgi:hypothetical protein